MERSSRRGVSAGGPSGAAAGGAPPAEPPAPLVEGGAPDTDEAQIASETPESPLPEVGVQGGDPPVNSVSEQAGRQTDSQPDPIGKKINRERKQRNVTEQR